VSKELKYAVAYLRTPSAANVGADKDSEQRQRKAIGDYGKTAGYAIVEEFYQALPTDWVEVGKDGRALMVEPHVSAGGVKLGKAAYAKQMEYRGAVHNHLVAQVVGFRTFDKKAGKRADDIADAFVYAILRCLGDGRARRWDRLRRIA
jgi:hypothetical protein